MEYKFFLYDDINAQIQMSRFSTGKGSDEVHVIINLIPDYTPFEVQLKNIYEAQDRLMADNNMATMKLVMKRYFLSDVANQKPLMKDENNCAC